MEVVTPQLQSFMEEVGKGVNPEMVKATQDLGGLLVIDIGERGGGKTTKASWLAKFYKENEPDVRRIANVPIEDCYYVPDILRFLAIRLIEEGQHKAYEIKENGTVKIIPRTNIPAKMLGIVDETAISGWEARGSGSQFSALKSYLLALSRHLNMDTELISQMMSMVEKRGVWNADYEWLCEAKYVKGTNQLDHFRYRCYDANFHKTNEYELSAEDARLNIFGTFDSWDIPNYEALAEEYRIVFGLTEEDFQFYRDVRDGKAHAEAQPVSENVELFRIKKALRAPSGRWPGETFILGGKRFEVLQRDWDEENYKYIYRAREVPSGMFIEDTDEPADGGLGQSA